MDINWIMLLFAWVLIIIDLISGIPMIWYWITPPLVFVIINNVLDLRSGGS